MMIEQAKVLDYCEGIALVQYFSKGGCGGCAGQAHCGTKALSALSGEKQASQMTLRVNQPLAKGDLIEVGLAEQSLLFSVFWLYVVPLCVMIASTLLLSSLFENELLVAVGVLLALLIAFRIIKVMIQRKPMGQFTPVFLRKL